jgi:hypothetical protein
VRGALAKRGYNQYQVAVRPRAERWNPEVAIVFDAAACYRRAKVGSSHDDAHPDKAIASHGGGLPPHQICGEPLLHIAPYGPWQFEIVRNAARFFVYFVGERFSCVG